MEREAAQRGWDRILLRPDSNTKTRGKKKQLHPNKIQTRVVGFLRLKELVRAKTGETEAGGRTQAGGLRCGSSGCWFVLGVSADGQVSQKRFGTMNPTEEQVRDEPGLMVCALRQEQKGPHAAAGRVAVAAGWLPVKRRGSAAP